MPDIGEYRGEGEATEMWTGELWVPMPFIRESTAMAYGYTKNIEEMKADGRWDAFLDYAYRKFNPLAEKSDAPEEA